MPDKYLVRVREHTEPQWKNNPSLVAIYSWTDRELQSDDSVSVFTWQRGWEEDMEEHFMILEDLVWIGEQAKAILEGRAEWTDESPDPNLI